MDLSAISSAQRALAAAATAAAKIRAAQVTPQAALEKLIESGKYKPKTSYLPKQSDDPVGLAALDLEVMLPPAQVQELKKSLVSIPRSELFNFFIKNVWSEIPSNKAMAVVTDYIPAPPPLTIYQKATPDKVVFENMNVDVYTSHKDLLWGGIVELFNMVNLEYTLNNMISPADWEKQKTDAFVLSQNPEAVQKLKDSIQRSVDIASDPVAKPILEEYLKLPRLGDEGLEINRQNAIRQLLINKEYSAAQAVIDAFRYASQTVISKALSEPMPFDIVQSVKGK